MLDKSIEFVIAPNIKLIKCLYVQLVEQSEIFPVNGTTEYLLDFLIESLLLLTHRDKLNLHPRDILVIVYLFIGEHRD